jgi:hypothetical protein
MVWLKKWIIRPKRASVIFHPRSPWRDARFHPQRDKKSPRKKLLGINHASLKSKKDF